MIVSYVFEQYLNIAYLLNKMHNIFEYPLREDTFLLFKNIVILCSISMHYLCHLSVFINALGEQGALSLKFTNYKLSVSISSVFHSCFASQFYQGISGQFLPMQTHDSPLCCSTNNTEWLREYFPVSSFADQCGRCRVSQRRGDTKADESSPKII